MKKFIAVILLATLCSGAFAQVERKNEVSLSVGAASISDVYNSLAKMMTSLMADFTDTAVDFTSVGSLSGEYFHRVGGLVSVGGLISFNNLVVKSEGEITEVTNYFSLMPGIKLHWYEREKFSAYSKFAVGARAKFATEEKAVVKFTGQASLLGIEAGGRFRVFVEAGVGEQGLGVLGLRYRF